MKVDGHSSIVRAEVRGHELARHAVGRLAGGRGWAITCPIGWPRLWSRVADEVLAGFERGLAAGRGQPAPRRLEMAVDAARDDLAAGCEALVERMTPDATLLALLLERGELHVLSAGPARVYLHRRGRPQRLTPREDDEHGLLHASPVASETHLEPGDLVLAGSVSAFSTQAIDKVASVLDRDGDAPPSVLASLLTDPVRDAGVGAAAVVLRAS